MKDSFFERRKYPIGAEILDHGVHFRVWSPDSSIELVIEDSSGHNKIFPMAEEGNEYFSLYTKDAKAGTRYRFRLSNTSTLLADPASRFQPLGPAGPSQVIDTHFLWTDQSWPGLTMENQIIYELHIGTFTPEGTFAGALKKLPALAELGITIIEIMPINEFSGQFGWGYDGVNLFAPYHLYGSNQDLKAFINEAHQLRIGVVLDVVYNHLGPEDNQMPNLTKNYLNPDFTTDWGAAINFDILGSRQFFLINAEYWIQEYHFDGLRIDATPCFFTKKQPHILAELAQRIKKAGGKRKTIVIGENEPQNPSMLHPVEEGGYGFDALWNDDFHHTAYVRLTGQRDAYYYDYLGTPQEFVSSMKYGFLFQGQYYSWQKKDRGSADFSLNPNAFVIFLENHDQIANSLNGKRLHQLAMPGDLRALTCLLLLSPNTPLLFQGQEFGSEQPFCYFADHNEQLNALVDSGRKDFIKQFSRINNSNLLKNLRTPCDPFIFINCKLNWQESYHHPLFRLHKDLISLRKNDSVFQQCQSVDYDGAVINENAFLLRYFNKEYGDRLIIFNFGFDQEFSPAPQPLLGPGINRYWQLMLSSEDTKYDGTGTPELLNPHWKLVAHSAMIFKSVKKDLFNEKNN